MAAATSAVLEAAGCAVLPAPNLRTAIRLLNVIQARVILADPGPRLLLAQPRVWRRLVQRAAGATLVPFTDQPMPPDQVQEAGLSAVLAKPYAAERLLDVIREAATTAAAYTGPPRRAPRDVVFRR